MTKYFDGGLGTLIQSFMNSPDGCPELLSATNPSLLTSIHNEYIAAGADIIETNTFGANFLKLRQHGIEQQHDEINIAAVSNARKAIGTGKQLIAGSIGPCGQLLRPLGALPFDAVYDCYKKQARVLEDAGSDMIIIETMTDIQEMRAALLAVKENTRLPVICCMSYDKNGRTAGGTDAATATIVLDKLGADIIGANCSTGPSEMLSTINIIKANTSKPVIALPNAGIPTIVDGATAFPMKPGEFAKYALLLSEAGADYIGGCCGTTPEHIRASRLLVSSIPISRNTESDCKKFSLCSRSRTITNSCDVFTIGERINPTNRKALAAELRNGCLEMLKNDAINQLQNGADILDINLGISGINQPELMKEVVQLLGCLVDVPLAIDTTDAVVLEAGLRYFPGRALINSVSLESKRMLQFFKLAKKYGAAALILPVTDDGVPNTPHERLATVNKIIAAGIECGLTERDFVLDPLVLPAASDNLAVQTTLDTIRLYKDNFDCPITIGLSNVSYGLPNRSSINSAFLAAACGAGVTLPILNPLDSEIQTTLTSIRALRGILSSGTESSSGVETGSTDAATSFLSELAMAVYNGNKESARKLATAVIDLHTINDIVEKGITAGMSRCSAEYSEGLLFLPHILMAADAAQSAFSAIPEAVKPASTGKIVLGTISGDIHDLGKNIVAAILSNSGFEVIDLGKNVSRETFLVAWQTHRPDLIGFSALMTTTMIEISPTIRYLKDNGCTAMFIAGGAVLTEEYARDAGADGFAADAIDAVSLCKKLLAQR